MRLLPLRPKDKTLQFVDKANTKRLPKSLLQKENNPILVHAQLTSVFNVLV